MSVNATPRHCRASLNSFPGARARKEEPADFTDANDARRSPLATVLFGVEGITRVLLGSDFITVTKSDDKDWDIMKAWILGTIMEHFLSGKPVIRRSAAAPDAAESGGEDPIGAQIKDLIDSRIQPVATEGGGAVTYRGFKDGVAYLEFQGSASSLMNGIENMLRHYVPEVEAVKDHRDALPKPGLETPEGKAIQDLLEEQVNPAVAAHGGHISLIDVQDDTVYIRLEGGCQGCGMADVTLKQGVAAEIQRVAPGITKVMGVTDHAYGDALGQHRYTADQGPQSGGSCLLLWPLRAAERGVPADGVRWWDGPRRRIRERPGQPVQTVVGQELRRFGAAVGARHFPYQAGLPRATAPRPAAAIALCICGPGPRE